MPLRPALLMAFPILFAKLLSSQAPATPVFQPPPGVLSCPATVTVSENTPAAILIVTTDGSLPQPTSTPSPSSFSVSGPTTFRAIALSPNGSNNPSSYPSSGESIAIYNCGAVLGFADLHTHPASHLAFASDSNGNNGLFWGKPADDGNPQSFTPSNDLPECDSFDHNSGTIDPVQMFSDWALLSGFQKTVQIPNQDNGSGNPAFTSWPASVSITHQQMDISSIQRAFAGGLRLLFASVTDDELVTDLWQQKWSPNGAPPPVHHLLFDLTSAERQLTYIQNLASANSAWMQIVTSPSDARTAISNGKLAIVLSVEMDTLSPAQILLLANTFDVRHVIPIHLVDNPFFGGTALYNDEFNAENPFFNGSFYNPEPDNNVSFNLSSTQSVLTPLFPSMITAGLNLNGINPASIVPGLGLVCNQNLVLAALGIPPQPCPVYTGEFGYLPWPLPPVPAGTLGPPGQVNQTGLMLNGTPFLSLMQAQCGSAPCGLLLDVAHMGQNSALGALTLAEQYQYPLMDSHTGLRCDNAACSTPYGSIPSGGNERSLPTSQLQRIKNLGGVIGLGVASDGELSGISDPDPVGSWINKYSMAWSLMGGKGVAVGTDANGLSPLMPNDVIATNYPVTVGRDFGGMNLSPIPQLILGNRTFDFEKDGMATYGLLPDLLQAASLRTQGIGPSVQAPEAALRAIFHSAEDTIEMWEKVVQAEANIPPGGSNQIPSKCSIIIEGPWNQGVDNPVLGQPIQFYTDVFDQNGEPILFPVEVTYGGNVAFFPPPHLMTGLDHISGTITTPGSYTLTASFSSVSNFSCSASIKFPPVLNSITSPLAPAPFQTVVPLANANGATPLTLTGVGFSAVTSVSFGTVSVPVAPSSDTSLVVTAPPYSGPLDQAANVSVTASNQLTSNALSIEYFEPNLPTVTASSTESCKDVSSFLLEAYVQDATGALIENAPITFKVAGLSSTDSTQTSGEASYVGGFASLRPPNQQNYSGTATYRGFATNFLLTTPLPPSPVTCRGYNVATRPLGQGAIFQGLSVCLACGMRDLPEYFNDTKYYIDDLVNLGVVLPLGHNFAPDRPVTSAVFLAALSKVLAPGLSRLIRIPTNAERQSPTAITRGQAASIVTHLIGVKEVTGTDQLRINAVVKAGYLRTINGQSAPDQPLTRIEMVNLLWHVARFELAALASVKK